MSFTLIEQHKIQDLPVSYCKVDIHADDWVREYFPPSGFMYLNLFNPKRLKEDTASEFIDSTISVHWKTALRTDALKPAGIFIAGMLEKAPVEIDCLGHGQGSMVVMHPLIAYHLVQDRLDLLTDSFADLGELIGRAADSYHTLLTDDPTQSATGKVMTDIIRQRLAGRDQWRRDSIFHAVNLILSRKGAITIKELASFVCMSERNLERNFLAKVGVSPRTYAGICRFQYALRLLQSRNIKGLEDLVQTAGYYDTSHFMKDLRARTGDRWEYFFRDCPLLVETFMKVVGED